MRGNGTNGRRRLAATAIRLQPDSRLVGLVREGHNFAFEEIVRRYRAPLVAFAGAIVPRDQAEDVVQDALVRAHRALGRDSEINLRPWLYTIVRNRALNALRDQPVHEHLDENFDGVPQPPEVAARREELAALIASLRGLPEPQREALVGRELEGRSHEDIAESLGTTPGAVRGLIYRARTTLRDGLGLLVPLPVLRAVLGSGSISSEAAGAGGTAAAGLAAGGGGVALKAGATLGVAVLAVGSGIAIQHRGSSSDPARPATEAHAPGSDRAAASQPAGAGRLLADDRSGRGGPGSGSEDSSRGEDRGPSSSSGPGPGGGSSGEDSSGSGTSGHGGPGGGDDGGSVTSDDGGGSSGSGGGSSGSGGSDDGGGGGTSGSGGGDGGGTSGSGSGGGGETSGSDDGSSGDNSGPGGGDVETTTTTTTTTSSDHGGGEGPG